MCIYCVIYQSESCVLNDQFVQPASERRSHRGTRAAASEPRSSRRDRPDERTHKHCSRSVRPV